MHTSKLRGLIAIVLLMTATMRAQLNVSYRATTTVTTSYSPGDPNDDMEPSLTLTTTSEPPSSINYNGATGTFQFEFLAPEGYRFVVNPLDGTVGLSFQVAYTTYINGPGGGLTATGAPEITLLGLEGSAPSFNNYSTLGDLPHAYLSVYLNAGEITEAFSFTGLRYTATFLGTGANLEVPYFEGGNLSVYDGSYYGAEPGDHLQLLAVASAIPEPGTSAALAGVVMLIACVGARHFRAKRRSV